MHARSVWTEVNRRYLLDYSVRFSFAAKEMKIVHLKTRLKNPPNINDAKGWKYGVVICARNDHTLHTKSDTHVIILFLAQKPTLIKIESSPE